MANEPVNPKVNAGAVTAGIGGGSVAVLIIWLMQGAFGVSEASFTPERVVAITSLCASAGSWLGGFLRKA